MKKYKTITGILGLICITSLCAGIGCTLLYNHGDVFSIFVVFYTVFSTSFFFSSIINHTNIDIFIKDLMIGVIAVLICGFIFLLGTYETLAVVAPMEIFTIVIIKSNEKKL